MRTINVEWRSRTKRNGESAGKLKCALAGAVSLLAQSLALGLGQQPFGLGQVQELLDEAAIIQHDRPSAP